ncbi:hypothetical protein ACWT_4590 [Actinoplanes sp. SE50]|uniref:hypothetical protein n=1 Tax=unclassified Actinoplanes TaxID=2626549 RepID=UPI00023ED474|nr:MULTISPECIES: hypothetical protein [unclassified Actinoplanes]AEV85612.1 hypothetical protein ACPL_4721 [Actinoplanes sp. SE50/110]ATO84005.1 hypothetical protein ACWT_4590 [Actinoplanes sp. SE50]SLM01415.1 hypothetical protein ACSP50_4651 [Actinoplanes sp. SE50/110]
MVALARWGPDTLIPDLTPHALPGHRVTASRHEVIDPYIPVIVLAARTATALGVIAVATRRPRITAG